MITQESDIIFAETTPLVDFLGAIFKPPASPRVTERRSFERRKILQRARLVDTERDIAHRCIIRDISLAGALIGISRHARLSGVLVLEIAPDRTREVRICWRRGDAVGLAFR